MTLLLRARGSTRDEALTARRVLDPVVAAQAAPRLSRQDLAHLEGSVERMRLVLADDADFRAEDDAFLGRLARASGNIVLLVLVESLARLSAEADPALGPTPVDAGGPAGPAGPGGPGGPAGSGRPVGPARPGGPGGDPSILERARVAEGRQRVVDALRGGDPAAAAAAATAGGRLPRTGQGARRGTRPRTPNGWAS